MGDNGDGWRADFIRARVDNHERRILKLENEQGKASGGGCCGCFVFLFFPFLVYLSLLWLRWMGWVEF
jgi:hypothetical protein